MTNDGCGGNCTDAFLPFCSGDATRILHFDWLNWRWDVFSARLLQADPLLGLSFNTSDRSVDAALCRYDAQFSISSGCCALSAKVLVATGEQRRARRTDDWDFGSWKLECALDEYVAGASHTVAGKFHASIAERGRRYGRDTPSFAGRLSPLS